MPLSITAPCEVNGKPQQSDPGRTGSGPGPSGTEVRVTPPGKETWPTKALAAAKGTHEGWWEKVPVTARSGRAAGYGTGAITAAFPAHL